MSKSAVLAIALALLSVWVVMAAGMTAVWLTEEVRVAGLIVAERDARHQLDKAT